MSGVLDNSVAMLWLLPQSLRQGKISQAQASTLAALREALDIRTDGETSLRALHDTQALTRRYSLCADDAACLELALRKSLPLATLDPQLGAAAKQGGVALVS
jgi:predicted nucleic acid-binding protein